MRWRGRRSSSNVEDRRRSVGRPIALGGGGGVLLLIFVVIFLCMGGDPSALFDAVQAPPAQNGPVQNEPIPENDELANFVSVVLADTEDVWNQLFASMGKQYREPKLILFRDSVRSACGYQNAATGPFYCPLDQQVYIDLNFFQEMSNQLGAPGDFAQAYVVAHEVGHHVQQQLGISDQIHQLRRRAGEAESNELSVRQELQADFFAGVWAHHAQQNWNILEDGDIEEALRAANAIGDDRLQRRSRGYVVPESFTHGTSEQRMRWFMRGLRTGDMDLGDTFSVAYEDL